MPFIEQNIDKSLIRPQSSHTGRLSAFNPQGTANSRFTARPSSTNPQFAPSPQQKLYSSPPPFQKLQNQQRETSNNLKLNLKQHHTGGLILPLELTTETAYMNKKPMAERSEFNQQGGELVNMLKERRLVRPQIGRVDQVENFQLSVEGQTMELPRPVSHNIRSDTLKYVANTAKKEQVMDQTKRLEENSQIQLKNIKSQQSFSNYAKQLDRKIMTKKIVQKTPTIPKYQQEEKQQTKYALNDWIVKARAGTATNKSLRSKSQLTNKDMSLLNNDDQIEVAPLADEIEQSQETNQQISHKQLIDSIIITMDDVLPIFRCIKERIQLENIINNHQISQEERISQLRQIFALKNVHFSYAMQYEAQLHGEKFYQNLKDQYHQLLKTSPDIIANTLLQSEFVYLTFDTPEIRRYLTQEFLSKNKQISQTMQLIDGNFKTKFQYNISNPYQNCYELIVCAFDQICPTMYYTISGEGITEFQATNKETIVTTLEEWEHERGIFIKLRKINYFKQFRIRKCIFIWQSQIKKIRKTRAFAAINRLSLQANKVFQQPMTQICYILKGILFDLDICNYKLYTYEQSTSYVSKMFKGNEKYISKYYTHSERQIITLVQFVDSWNKNLININNFISLKVEQISEILLSVCRTVSQNIQARQLAASDKQKGKIVEKSSNAILSAISNATTFNMTKIKALIKASDNILAETLLQKLVDANTYLQNLLFGIPQIPVKFTQKDELLQQLDQLSPEDKEIMIQYQKNTLTKNEYRQLFDENFQTDFQLLQVFLQSIGDLGEISSHQLDEPGNIYQFKFDKYSKKEQFGEREEYNSSISQDIMPQNINSYLQQILSNDEFLKIVEFKYKFTSIPLAIMNEKFPPYPLFTVQISIENAQFSTVPTKQDFIDFIGDCLSEIATIAHRSIRPFSYPKLSAFLSETTRTSNLAEFMGLNIKESIAVNDDYIESIRRLKSSIFYGFDLIEQYCQGYNGILQQFLTIITEFNYHLFKNKPKITNMANDILQLTNMHGTFEILIYFWSTRDQRFYQIIKELAFPGLQQIEQFVFLTEDDEQTDVLNINHFQIPQWNIDYYNRMRSNNNDYIDKVQLIQPHQFKHRVEEINNYLVQLHLLKVERSILCFQTSSISLFEQIIPFVVFFSYFVRLSLPLSILKMSNNLSEKAVFYVEQLQKVPEIPLSFQEEVKIPKYKDYDDSLFDFSVLISYVPNEANHLQTLKDQFKSELIKIQEVNKIKKEEAENQKRIFEEAQQLMQQKLKFKSKKNKKNEDKTDLVNNIIIQDDNEEVIDDEESAQLSTLQKQLNDLDLFQPFNHQIYSYEKLTKNQQQMQKCINDIQVDKLMLNTVKEIIEIYEQSKNDITIFREAEKKILQLFDAGQVSNILDDSGNIIIEDLSLFILKDLFKLDLEKTIKEQFKEFQVDFQHLERSIINFTVKKPKLYAFFKYNLVVLYTQLGYQTYDIIHDILKKSFTVNVYINEEQQFNAHPLILDGKLVQLQKQQLIQTEQELYLYLLMQNTDEFDQNNYIYFQNLTFIQYDEQIQEIIKDELYFNRCLELFESTEFYVSQNNQKTEVFYIIQLAKYLQSLFSSYWNSLDSLKTIIQSQGCQPISLINIQNFKEQLQEILNQILQVQQNYNTCFTNYNNIIDNVTFNQEGQINYVPSVDDIQYNFSTLKILIFIYKQKIKQAQMAFQEIHYDQLSNLFHQQLEQERDQKTEVVDVNYDFLNYDAIYTQIDSDKIEFTRISKDAIQFFFGDQQQINLTISLIKKLIDACPVFDIISNIQFQPRHFQKLGKRILPSPDLAYEIHIFDMLIQIDEVIFSSTLSDLLDKDRINAYRQIFDQNGDGIQELLFNYLAIQPRKETFQKVLMTLKLYEQSSFSWELRNYYIDIIDNLPNLMNGKSVMDYTEQLSKEDQDIQDSLEPGYDISQQKYYDTDAEQLADFETIQNKAQVHQNIVVTLGMHIAGVKQRLTEILIRRSKYKNYQNHKYIRYILGKGGLYQELDRFSATISRLVFRNLFSKENQVQKLAEVAQLEYNLLSKLSGIKQIIYDLRFKMSVIQNDSTKFHFISDATFVHQQLNDQLINLHTLSAQFKNLNSKDIEIAQNELYRLENVGKQTIQTIQTLVLCQNVVLTLFPVFNNSLTPVTKALPEEARTFQKYFTQFSDILQAMFDSGCLAVKNCTLEIAQQVKQKIYPEFESIQYVLEKFLQSKRESFCRFYFLNDKLLCNVLSLANYEVNYDSVMVTLNNSLDFMFQNIKQVQCNFNTDQDGQKRYIVTDIVSQEGEMVQISQFALRGQSEIWLTALSNKITTSLQTQVHNCFTQLLYLTREYMGMCGDEQIINKQTKIELLQFEKKILGFLQNKYAIQIVNIVIQSLLLFFIDNVDKYYQLESFNLNFQQQIQTEKQEIEEEIIEDDNLNVTKKLKQVKTPTIQMVIQKLLQFYQFFKQYIVQILKQNLINNNKLDTQRFQLILQNLCQIIQNIEMLDRYYNGKGQLVNFLTYYYNHVSQQLYTIDLQQHIISIVQSQKKLIQELNFQNPNGILYGYEFQGLQLRAICFDTFSLQQQFIYKQKLALQQPILISSLSGQGKSSFIYDYSYYQGQFISTIQAAKNTQSTEFINNIIGSCLGGSYLVFEDIDELQLDIISILSIYLQQITQSLRTYQLSFNVNKGIYKIMPSTQFFATIKTSSTTKLQNFDQFKHICLVAPDSLTIIQQSLLYYGFINYNSFGLKLQFFFKALYNNFVGSKTLFNSFRIIKQYLIIVQSTWRKWLQNFSKNEKLLSYFKNQGASYKQQKEQQVFNLYIEQYCLVFCLFQFLLPQFNQTLQYDQFNVLVNSIFDNDIVNVICKYRNSSKQIYTHSIKTRLQRTSRMSSLSKPDTGRQYFSLEDIAYSEQLLLLYQLTLSQNNFIQDQSSFQQQNIFIGDQQLILTQTELDFADLDFNDTEKTELIQSNTNPQECTQDSLSDSGKFLQLSHNYKDDMFTLQVQSAINSYINHQKIQQINYFIQCIQKHKFLITQNQLNSYQEFEGALWYRTCVILRGSKGSGKTTLWKSILNKSNNYIVLTPESLSERELFGFMTNGYFSDGIIPQFIRNAYSHLKQTDNPGKISTLNLQFIVFNGYSDKLFRLLSAIDDSRYLQLQNSENLRIPNYIRIIFEVENTYETIPDAFIQRCITVNIDGDFWRHVSHKAMKDLFPESYNQFINEYTYDQDSNQISKKVQQNAKQTKKSYKTKEKVNKFKEIIPLDNIFYQISYSFSRIVSFVHTLVAKSQVSMLFVVKQIFIRFELYNTMLKQKEDIYQTILSYQQMLYFAAFHTLEPFIELNALALKFKDLIDTINKRLQEELQLSKFSLSLPQDLFMDFNNQIPLKIHDDLTMQMDQQDVSTEMIFKTNLNYNSEKNIASIYFDDQQNKLIIQNIQQRRIFTQLLLINNCFKAGQTLLISGYNANYYNSLLFQQPQIKYQKIQFSISKQTTLLDFKTFFVSLFNSQEGIMVPTQLLPLIVHIYDFQHASIEIISFFTSLGDSAQVIYENFTFQNFPFTDFKFIISTETSLSSFENAIICDFKQFQPSEYETVIFQTINSWSTSFSQCNQSIFPVFTFLSHFVTNVMKSLQHYSNFNFDLFVDFLGHIFKLDAFSFTCEIGFENNLFDSILKRQLYQTFIFILRISVFNVMQIPTIEQQQIINESVQKSCLSQQIAELKNGVKIPIKYHSELLLDEKCFYLNAFQQSKIDYEITQINRFKPVKCYKFVEANFPKQFQELILSSQPITELVGKCPDVFSRSELMVLYESNMVENRQRFFYIGYLLTSYKRIVVLDRPGYSTRYIYSQAASRLNYKFVLVGEAQQDQLLLYNKFIACVLQQLLKLLTTEDSFKIALFISDEYLQNNRVKQALQQLMMHGSYLPLFIDEPILASDVLYHLRLRYDIEGQYTDIQLKNQIALIIKNMFIFILAPEHDTYKDLSLKYLCTIEKSKIWPIQSVAMSAIGNLPIAYQQMKKLCSNNKILNTFLMTFQQMITIISPNKQFYNIVLSPGYFTRFLKIYHKIYFMKRQQLGDKSAILQKGIELFDEGQRQTVTIQSQLTILQPQVQLLQANTDLLLITLQQQQLDIKTQETAIYSEERKLQVQGQTIDIELKQSQVDLDEVMPILKKAENALKLISRQEIAEISSFTNPKTQIVLVMSAICVVLGEQPTWQTAKQLLSSGSLISQLMTIKPLQLPPKQFKQFKQIVQGSEFKIDKISPVSQAAATLAQWCIAVINYHSAFEHIQPRIDRLNQAKLDYKENQDGLQKKKDEILQIISKMEKVKHQLDSANVQKIQLENQMQELVYKLQTISDLNVLLQKQDKSWNQEFKDCKQDIEQLSVLSLIGTIYTMMQFSQKYNVFEHVMTKFILNNLEFKNVDNITNQKVYQFIAGQEQQSQWKLNGLFGDQVTLIAMLSLSGITNCPYIVDPDLVFNKSLVQLQHLIIKLDDAKLLQTILDNLDQPKTIIIQIENSDSWFIPYFIKQLVQICKFNINNLFSQSQCQQLTKHYFDDKVYEINNEFQILLLDNQTQYIYDLQSEIFVNYQVISFIKDDSSFHQLIQNCIIETINPEIQQQRQDIIRQQAQQSVQLQAIDQQIIKQLICFDFNKDLNKTGMILIKELQDGVATKESIEHKLLELDSINSQIEQSKLQYSDISSQFVDFYNAIIDIEPYYRFQLFITYLKKYINYDKDIVFQHIIASIDQQKRVHILFRLLCYQDIKQTFDTIQLQMIQSCIISKDIVSFYDNNTGLIQQKQYYINQVDDIVQSNDYNNLLFVQSDSNNEIIEQRRASITYLLQGLFKTNAMHDGKEDQVIKNSLFYKVCISSLKRPQSLLNKDVFNFNNELQTQIIISLQTKWQSHYSLIFDDDYLEIVNHSQHQDLQIPKFYEIIYQICQEIINNVKDFQGKNVNLMVFYLSILFVRLLKQEYFIQIMQKFIDYSQYRSPFNFSAIYVPEKIIKPYINEVQLQPISLIGDTTQNLILINSQLQKYEVQQRQDQKFKPAQPKIQITSFAITDQNQLFAQLTESATPTWIVLLDFEFATEKNIIMLFDLFKQTRKHQTQISLDAKLFFLSKKQFWATKLSPQSQLLINSIPMIFNQIQISFKSYTQQISNAFIFKNSELNQVFYAQIYIFIKQFLALQLHSEYQNIAIQFNEQSFQQLVPFLWNQMIQQYLQDKQILDSRILTDIIIQTFGTYLSPFQKNQIDKIFQFIQSSSTDIDPLNPKSIGLPSNRVLQFYSRLQLKSSIPIISLSLDLQKLSKTINQQDYVLQQYLLDNGVEVNQNLDMSKLQNPQLLFSILLIQAQQIYGFSPSDFTLVYSVTQPFVNDLVLTNFKVVNGSSKYKFIRVLARIYYKRRFVYLPLFTPPILQDQKQTTQRVSIKLPESRFSEFSVGPINVNDEQDIQVNVKEKSIKEKRFQHYLVGQVQIATKDIEIRRAGQLIQTIQFEGNEEFGLFGTFLEI